jgi:hypothetical protein
MSPDGDSRQKEIHCLRTVPQRWIYGDKIIANVLLAVCTTYRSRELPNDKRIVWPPLVSLSQMQSVLYFYGCYRNQRNLYKFLSTVAVAYFKGIVVTVSALYVCTYVTYCADRQVTKIALCPHRLWSAMNFYNMVVVHSIWLQKASREFQNDWGLSIPKR